MTVASILEWLKRHEPAGKTVLGFDAFTDSIAHRASGLGAGEIGTMSELGKRLIAKGNTSGTLQLPDLIERPGGNTVNVAGTLAGLGADVLCFGPFGRPAVREAFEPLSRKCEIVSYANPGQCLAIEFEQNKLFISANGELDHITWQTFLARAGREKVLKAYSEARVIGLFNWGELKPMQQFWKGLLGEILPAAGHAPKTIFVDFSDVSYREDGELREAFDTLKAMRAYGRIVVSANASEAKRLDGDGMVREGAADVFILHAKNACEIHTKEETDTIPTRVCAAPALLTGGGDNFNAGFLYGMLTGLEDRDAVKVGMAAAGCLVRNGEAATRERLYEELAASASLWD